jgi:tetratricopeptide (TPR) repeat protein
MCSKRVALVAAMMALCAFASFAQESMVAFVDGSVQLKSGLAWKDLDIGQKLEAGATVRLGSGALLELTADGGRSLLLSKAGTYDLAPLWKTAPAAKGTASKLLSVVERVAAGTSAAAPSSVAGVRGAASDTDDMLWLEDAEDPETLYQSGRKAEAEGRYAEAAVFYAEALRIVNERAVVDKSRACASAYAAARAYVAAGQLGRALAALKSADPAASGELRPAYALLMASLLAEFGDAESARVLLAKGKAEAWFAGDALKEADALIAVLKK